MKSLALKRLTLGILAFFMFFGSTAIGAEEAPIQVEDITISTWDEISEILEDIEAKKHTGEITSEEEETSYLLEQIVSEEYSNNGIQPYGVYDEWTRLTAAEKKLVVLYPHAVSTINWTRTFAYNSTTSKFGSNGTDDNSDAYRHALWNMAMTSKISAASAKMWSDAHETESYGLAKTMDLFNNKIGWEQSHYGLAENEMLYRAHNLTKYGALRRFRIGNTVYTTLQPTKL